MIAEDPRSNKEERTKIFTNVIFKRPVAVLIQTTDQRIRGNVHVRPDDRLRDELNESERFLAVTNATIYNNEDQVLYRSKFIAVNISQIIWLIPQNDLISLQEEQ
jgi:hypothetical protein